MTRHRTRWIALTVAVLLVAFGVVLAVQHRTEASTPRLVQEHKPAPTFDLTAIDGRPVATSALAGKTYVVNFWNSWCIPCQQEAPALAQFYAQHQDETDFAMVGIVRDDTTDEVRAYVKKHGIDWTIALDPDSVAALDFGTRGQPETYAISPSGTVAAAKYGPMSTGELERFLDAARVTG